MSHQNDEWKSRAVQFDKLYSGETWERRIPLVGNLQRERLNERMERALAFLEQCGARRVVDIGCGGGRFAVRAALMGVSVTGYDLSNAAIELARERAQRSDVGDRCRFQQANILDVDFPDADAWFDLGCLQYLENIAPLVRRLANIRNFFSCLPRRGHWLNGLRYGYRTLLKGSRFYSYSEADVKQIFGIYPTVKVHADGNKLYVTSK